MAATFAEYNRWILENVEGNGYGKCREWSQEMASFFPELKVVRGHYHCSVWGTRTHWWCVAPDGMIVDPTRDQFPSMGTDEYEPWAEGDAEPTGKCPNCEGYVYDGDTCCSPKCHDEFRLHVMAGN